VDEDKNIMNEIKVKEMFYKAQRCFYIAKSFEETNKWKEASALYARSEELAGSARVLIENSKLDFNVKELLNTIRKQRCVLASNQILTKHSILEEKKTSAKEPIMNNLDEFVVDQYGKPVLTAFPPEYEAIACKPVFLDKAIHYINYPEIKKESKGWFSSWF
jgi:signal recognition particle subunit SRP68